ncbi:MAG: TIGR03960 family B12-binding radical SAM protein [Ruminococcaceae bacterium]|nr:TIGR03960 family B12-binding radical SAM protein [Oscillospiraceae bacterium]
MSYISDDILYNVEKPARYTGGEWNSIIKNKSDVDIRFAFCFADIYDIGMSHLGMKILYHLLNERPGTWCERVFSPWPDLEKEMRANGLKLFALESQEPIDTFDFIGFTMQYEMSFTNIINMIELAGVPIKSADRTEGMPFVIGGGPAAVNPEPLADYFDLYNIGDGEEMLPEIMEVYAQWKKDGAPRIEFLRRVSKIEGVYVPSMYEPKYDENDGFISLDAKPEFADCAPKTVRKRVVQDLDKTYFPEKQVVPYTAAVHDRIMLEIFRGCIRGCRFCQAGFIYRPVRERKAETLLNIADKLVKSTGYEEISLLSLSTSDFTELPCLTEGLLDAFQDKHVNLALPSLRVDSFSLDLMEKVSKVRKSGITFAPEAGTQRMRDVINKGVNEEDLLRSVEMVFKGGWHNIKLYFMIGLPTETDEDVLGIADLAFKVLKKYDEVHAGKKARRPEITVSVSTFVPKPFTPFQWCEQITIDEIRRRQDLLKHALNKRISFSWHDPKTSVLEGVLARGDRRCGDILYEVWKEGGGFDAWSEYMDYDSWRRIIDEAGKCCITGKDTTLETPLPWQHIDVGVSQKFFKSEYEKAMLGILTPNCREKCSGCGAACYKGGVCVGK